MKSCCGALAWCYIREVRRLCTFVTCRTVLRSSGVAVHPRYLHSAVLSDSLMLVFAGNTHNDTSSSKGAKCFSSNFMAYDLGEPPTSWPTTTVSLELTALDDELFA